MPTLIYISVPEIYIPYMQIIRNCIVYILYMYFMYVHGRDLLQHRVYRDSSHINTRTRNSSCKKHI